MNDCVTVPGCTLCKGKLVCVLNQTRPHKDVWGSGGTLHIFLTLVQDWAECMLKSLYPWGKKPSYTLVVRQGETQIRYGRNGGKESPSAGKKKADLQQYYAYWATCVCWGYNDVMYSLQVCIIFRECSCSVQRITSRKHSPFMYTTAESNWHYPTRLKKCMCS